MIMKNYIYKMFYTILTIVFFSLNFVSIYAKNKTSIKTYCNNTIETEYNESQYKYITLTIDDRDSHIITIENDVKLIDFSVMGIKPVSLDDRIEIEDKIENYKEEIKMIAKVIYNEARGVEQYSHKAAVAWTIFNRYDNGKYGNSIKSVITSPNQFAYWKNTPVLDEFVFIAKDVMIRWLLEKYGYKNVGRVLPKDYLFYDADGYMNLDNRFRKKFEDKIYWDWSLQSPFE